MKQFIDDIILAFNVLMPILVSTLAVWLLYTLLQ